MVLYHIQFVGDEKYSFSFLMIKNFGDCVVPAFAIISGFLFWSTVRNFDDLKGKYKRRIYSLLFPYALWNLINTLFVNWQVGKRGVSLLDLNIWRNIIMWDSSPHFWYLFMLMFWTVLSPILYLLYNKKEGRLVLLLLSGAYLFYKGDLILHSRFIYILYTWAGMIGFCYPDLLNEFCFEGKKRRTVIYIALTIYLGIYFIYCVQPLGMGVKVWLYAIRAVALLITLFNFPFAKIGVATNYKYSFWIYAVHYWLDNSLGGIISAYISNAHIYQIVTWGTVTAIGLTIGIIVSHTLSKVFKLLTGSRG